MNGFYNVNKPEGISSRKVVNIISSITRKNFNVKKTGHLGTLDPIAVGVLPIAVGNCTRFFEYALNKKKQYRTEFEFGRSTDTLDFTGIETKKTDNIPKIGEIKSKLPDFIGEIMQIPPTFSAKSVNGVRAYKLAREGKTVELKACKVTIYDLNLVSYECGKLVLDITCSAGTYIRSICRDLAESLNSLAIMTKLERKISGEFKIDCANTIEEIEKNPSKLILPPDFLVSNFELVELDDIKAKKCLNGQEFYVGSKDGVRVFLNGKFLGFGCDTEKGFKFKVKM